MHEYRVVPAPVRAVKVKGAKTTAERFSHTLALLMNDLGEEGWEFLRSETLSCEERGWLGGRRMTSQTVLVFHRALPVAGHVTPAHSDADTSHHGVPGHGHHEDTGSVEPALSRQAPGPVHDTARAEPVFRPGALVRAEGPRQFPPLRGGDERS